MNNKQPASQEEIGKFLKQLREKNKMTQEDVAKELHYSRDVISQIERGISMPSYDKAIVLSKLFNVSIYEIYGARKISDDSKKEIQEIMDNTTYAINAKFTKKLKLFLSIIMLLITVIFLFLAHYFLNSYNSVKVYKLHGENDRFKTNNALLYVSKDKMHLSLNVIPKDNIKVEKIALKYKNDREDKLVQKIDGLEIYISDIYGYEAYFSYDDIINNKNKFFLEIYYDDTQDVIDLDMTKLSENKKFFFTKVIKETTEEKNNFNYILPQKIVDTFTKENNAYTYKTKKDDKTITMTYDDSISMFTVIEDDSKNLYTWMYNLEYKILDYEVSDIASSKPIEIKSIDIQNINDDEEKLYQYFKINYIDKYLN